MTSNSEFNIGQLVREQYGNDVVLIGFSTYTGTVTAASEWGAPAEYKKVLPALPESYEALFHETRIPCFVLDLRGEMAGTLQRQRLERAIGVVYLPQTERFSHYFNAVISEQFDIILHMDTTNAVEPLDRSRMWKARYTPEGFPTCSSNGQGERGPF